MHKMKAFFSLDSFTCSDCKLFSARIALYTAVLEWLFSVLRSLSLTMIQINKNTEILWGSFLSGYHIWLVESLEQCPKHETMHWFSVCIINFFVFITEIFNRGVYRGIIFLTPDSKIISFLLWSNAQTSFHSKCSDSQEYGGSRSDCILCGLQQDVQQCLISVLPPSWQLQWIPSLCSCPPIEVRGGTTSCSSLQG